MSIMRKEVAEVTRYKMVTGILLTAFGCLQAY